MNCPIYALESRSTATLEVSCMWKESIAAPLFRLQAVAHSNMKEVKTMNSPGSRVGRKYAFRGGRIQ
jgi:hypothetical protein